MNPLTLRKLEYEKIVEMVTAECSSSLGKTKAADMMPVTDYDQILAWQQETSEGVTVRRMEPNIPLGGLADLSRQIRKAQIGGVLEPEEFLQLLDMLKACKRMSHFFLERKRTYEIPRLEWWAGQITQLPELEREIDDVIAPEAVVRDSASNELLSVRRKINTLKNRIRERLEHIVRSETSSKYLQDALVTIRNDRYVVPVKQEYRSQIPGIIHDQSASGATLFIEPMAVVEMNNDLRKAYSTERDEVARILQELSAKLMPYVEDLAYNMEVLAQIDFIFAKARLSEKMNAVEPKLKSTPELNIIKARHPLIDAKKVVPLSISLGQEFDSVIITGPNTGGKTVTLKTVGLFALMAQSGLHIPAEVGSEMGIFHGIYADIGDEQSIEQSLSTFSSHMTNIVRFLPEIDYNSLVLLDELGAGTDPSEGAALAISILDDILHKGGKIVATTHYSELKAYAFDEPRVQNASVEFDVETLRPTYRLLIGVPGKSNAFEIAGKLGIHSHIIEQARGMISKEEQDVAGLIASLETSNILAEQKKQEAEDKLQEIQAQLAALEAERAQLVESTEKIRMKAEAEALDIIREARRESEEILKELRQMQLDNAKAQAEAQEKRKKLSEQEDKLAEKLNKGPKIVSGKVTKVKLGEEVYIPKFTQHGAVLSLPDKKGNLQVQVGIMKVTVNLEELQQSAKPKETGKTMVHKISSAKTENISSELDLRGLLVEEALDKVDKYLDDAYLSSLAQVRIIHGKGTGALRSAVRDQLKHHRHVKTHYFGSFHEGGDGVTVVELKK
ncbi:MAG: endonuclease MutS2 [Peptococcaceae bacterium]|nr:endonuclease MutS2 [Peptococcaceae bacterium]